jgi:hypothetical protein
MNLLHAAMLKPACTIVASADPDDIGGGPDERRLRRTQCLSRAQ